MQLQEIPIKKIRVVENHRTQIDKHDLRQLANSIKQNGLMQPVGVAQDGKSGYVLRFGERRLLACKQLGHKTIKATVVEKISKENLLIENLIENMQRKDPSFAEIGRVIKRLEDEIGLKRAQIAEKLGMPAGKICQILQVYEALPEKFRQKVMFMEKGGGRKDNKGCIPADAAIKLASMKKNHGLAEKEVNTIFKSVIEDGMDKLDLNNVGNLIGSGMSADEALRNVRDYGVFTIDIVAKHEEVSRLMNEYSIQNRQNFLKKIIYGEIPPLAKPSFVDTGRKAVKNKVVHLDTKPYQAMMRELLRIRRTSGLTEEQSAAVEHTNKIQPIKWTQQQCDQIKVIYESVK